MNDKLNWTDNTEALHGKGQSGMFFLKMLRPYKMYSRLLLIFYQSSRRQ